MLGARRSPYSPRWGASSSTTVGVHSQRATTALLGRLGTHVDDAAALLGALSAGPAIVIGRSYGGAVAIQLALRYPERVRALVLLEAFIGSLVPEAEAWETELARRLEVVASTSDNAVAEELIDYGLGEGAWASFPDEIKRIFADNADAILDEELDPPAMDDPTELGRIDVRTLVVAQPRRTPCSG